MKLANIVETEDSQWVIKKEPLVDPWEIRRRIDLLDHQADLMLSKFEKYAKVYKDKVFSVSGTKSGIELPKQVLNNPRKFISFTLVHKNTLFVTKVFVSTEDPKIVLAVRSLVERHNELTNQRSKLEGILIGLK